MLCLFKEEVSVLREQTEMLFLFIKNHHQIQSQSFIEHNKIFITEEVNEWIEKTWTKHRVSVVAFAFDWAHRFMIIQICGKQNINEKAEVILESMSTIYDRKPIYLIWITFIKGYQKIIY